MKSTELKSAQDDLGMTNQQLADELGVSLSTVVKWRGGQHKIPKVAALAVRYLMTCQLKSSRGAGAGYSVRPGPDHGNAGPSASFCGKPVPG